ncbi:MAG: phage portal protein [Nostoc sp.]
MEQNPKSDKATENWSYYCGDTFQFWTGPKPAEGDQYSEVITKQIEEGYISNNLIKECVDRNVAAMIGLMPHWFLYAGSEVSDSNKEERSPQVMEAEKILQTWITQMLKHIAMQDGDEDANPLTMAVTQMLVTGRGYLRIYRPKRYKKLLNAKLYQKIRLHCPALGSVRVDRDDDGEIEQISYTYKGGTEIQSLDPETGKLTFTVTHSGDRDGEQKQSETWVSDFGGRWTIYELRSPPIINKDIKRLQNAINKALTMLGRNLDLAGFLERVITNAQTPGEWIEDPNRPGKQRFVPDKRGLQMGAGKTTFLSGIKLDDGAYTTPGVTYRDPIDITTFVSSVGLFAARLYLAFNQGHILASGDGAISGISRVQLRQDANLSLDRPAPVIENAFANILEVVLRFLEPVKYKDTFATVKLRKGINYITPEETAETRTNYQVRLISRTTAMSNLGIEDPDAEAALIDEELAKDAMSAAFAIPGLSDNPAASNKVVE